MAEALISDRVANIIDEEIQYYRKRGYQVVTEPIANLEGMPPEWHPDLVVRNDDEIIVVEIATRQKMEAMPGYLHAFAAAIKSKPGWTYNLITVTDFEPEPDPEMPISELSEDEVSAKLEHSTALLNRGDREAAFKEAWEALSGLLRRVVTKIGYKRTKWTYGEALTSTYHYGYMRDDTDLHLLVDSIDIYLKLNEQQAITPEERDRIPQLIPAIYRILSFYQQFKDLPPERG